MFIYSNRQLQSSEGISISFHLDVFQFQDPVSAVEDENFLREREFSPDVCNLQRLKNIFENHIDFSDRLILCRDLTRIAFP